MSTTVKISRSRAGQVWVKVTSVACPDIQARELFADIGQARSAVKGLQALVERQAAAEQARLNAVAAPMHELATSQLDVLRGLVQAVEDSRQWQTPTPLVEAWLAEAHAVLGQAVAA